MTVQNKFLQGEFITKSRTIYPFENLHAHVNFAKGNKWNSNLMPCCLITPIYPKFEDNKQGRKK